MIIRQAIIFFLTSATAAAHGSYPWECCHDRDCAPIDARAVQKEADGSFTVTLGPNDHPMLKEAGQVGKKTWVIPPANVRKPLNGDYHVCFSPQAQFLCFFDKSDGG